MSLGETRHEKILSLLGESREVYVSRLAKQLQVSEMTIRRDLKLLEQQGKLKRVFGGAVSAIAQTTEIVERRVMRLHEEKRQIALRALKCIELDSLIFIGGSSATAVFTEAFAAIRSVRVVTHSIQIAQHSRQAMVLADHSKFGAKSSALSALDFSEVDTVVTDRPVADEYLDAIREHGGEILWP